MSQHANLSDFNPQSGVTRVVTLPGEATARQTSTTIGSEFETKQEKTGTIQDQVTSNQLGKWANFLLTKIARDSHELSTAISRMKYHDAM